ncbi:MAG: choice-of-anchor D domain-containing protein [Archangium sp.]|nr:choice-of-anchor D domain-containing protein [Archangium sp.]MDP3574974.1 choice-of-anchor D domain-containing protein [Archangium sp.]
MRYPFATLLLVLSSCAPPGELVFSRQLIDFGAAVPGLVRRERVELINQTGATLELTTASSTHPSFSLLFPPRMTFSAGETREIEVRYAPGGAAPEEATLEVATSLGNVTASMRVKGTPTTPDCELPQRLDFGPVARGDQVSLEVALLNSTSLEGIAFVGPVETFQEPAFSTESGSFPLAAQGEHQAVFTFQPAEARAYAATVRLSRHQLCAEQPVALAGSGVASALAWTPATAELGPVAVGATARTTVVFTNLMFRPLQLSEFALREGSITSSVFSVMPSELTVPAATRAVDGTVISGMASVELSFTPTASGARSAQLTASTGLTSQPTISVSLRAEAQ